MKKIFFNLILILGLSLIAGNANAQVCKISGSNDNVEVFSCQLNGDKVDVTLSNDSNDIKANVTVTVEVKYENGRSKTFSGKVLANPGTSTSLQIPINAKDNNFPAKSVIVTSISGTKCI